MTFLVTDQWMRDQSACKAGYKELLKLCPDRDAEKILEKCIEQYQFEFANWLFVRLLNYENYLAYTAYASHLAWHYRSECLETHSGTKIMIFGLKLFKDQYA